MLKPSPQLIFLLGEQMPACHLYKPNSPQHSNDKDKFRPTTRNPSLEMLDEGIYHDTTATTTMDEEHAAYRNRRNCLDSSGNDATSTLAIGRIAGNEATDDD